MQVYSFNTVTNTSFTWVHGFILRHFGTDCILKSCILQQNESIKNEKDQVRSFQRSSMFLLYDESFNMDSLIVHSEHVHC